MKTSNRRTHAAARRRKTARRVSIICGLGLAAVTSVITYATLLGSSARSSAGAYKAINLRQFRSFAIAAETSFQILGDTSFQLSPNGKIVVGITNNYTNNSQLYVFSLATGQQLITGVDDGTPPVGRQFGSPAFGPVGNVFAITDSSSTEAIDIWTSASKRMPLMRLGINDYASWATPGPAELMAYGYGLGLVSYVYVKNGRSDGELLSDKYPDWKTVFSPDGKIIAVSGGKGLIFLWNVETRRLIATLTAEKLFDDTWWSNPYSTPDIDALSFSPDSKEIACGTDSGIVRVWNVANRRNIITFSINGYDPSGAAARPVTALIFSPDGRSLVTADSAGGLSIWSVSSGRKIATITALSGEFESVAFTNAGALLVTTENDSTSDHKIEIWTTVKSLAAILPVS